MNKRLDYLDNLKVALTVLVVFHHAGQAYRDGGDWAYTPSNSAEMMPWIWHFFSVNAAFFMGLFFFISGYFVPMSYDKQGGEAFVKKKLMRLGVPFILMAGIISCLSGKVEFAHMWFVGYRGTVSLFSSACNNPAWCVNDTCGICCCCGNICSHPRVEDYF